MGRRCRADEGGSVLETDRLLLRQLSEDDLCELARIYSDPEVMRYILPPCTDPAERARRCIEGQRRLYAERGFGLWATIHKEHDAFIGRCGLLPWEANGRHEVEMGWLIARNYWGSGLGTEVGMALREYGFERLGLKRLVSQIHPGNIASHRVAEKCGMRHEGEAEVCGTLCRIYTMTAPGAAQHGS